MRNVHSTSALFGFLIFSVVAIWTLPAHAGPNRTIHIDDRPVGATLTHVFLVRTITDTLETYNSQLTHQFLVKQDVTSGRVEKHWLLRRFNLETMLEPSDTGKPERSLDVYEPPITENEGKPAGAPPDATLYNDAFQILRSERAVSISGIDISRANSPLNRWKVSSEHGLEWVSLDGETGKPENPSARDIRLAVPDIRRQMRDTLHPTLAEMKKFNPADHRSAIPVESLSEDISACGIDTEFHAPTRFSAHYMKLYCEMQSELIRSLEIWIVVD
ncbi:hypothetical protein [Anderseniella sp. Alg231-50]|uniref:hypothetical protein n=1 Tax=Anderseniella sp. Alg231-50 TaxID=1922226 RepID=UPI00307C952B